MKIRINQFLSFIWIAFFIYISYQLYIQHIGGSGWGINTATNVLGFHPFKLYERWTDNHSLDHYQLAWINMGTYGLSIILCVGFIFRKRFTTQLYIFLMLLVITVSTLNLIEITTYDLSKIPYFKKIYSNSLLFHSGLIFFAILSIVLAYTGYKSGKSKKR